MLLVWAFCGPAVWGSHLCNFVGLANNDVMQKQFILLDRVWALLSW